MKNSCTTDLTMLVHVFVVSVCNQWIAASLCMGPICSLYRQEAAMGHTVLLSQSSIEDPLIS